MWSQLGVGMCVFHGVFVVFLEQNRTDRKNFQIEFFSKKFGLEYHGIEFAAHPNDDRGTQQHIFFGFW